MFLCHNAYNNKKVIESIKDKIKKDETLSNALIIVQNDGFGLFVNKKH